MVLIVCLECRKEISSKASKCPHCGAPIAPDTSVWRPAPSGPTARSAAIRAAKYVLLAAALGAGWWIWQAATSDRKAPFSAGLGGAFREPRTVADGRVSLKAGRHVSYAFGLDTDSRVHVRITALAAPVDMMLMPKADAARFGAAGGDLFGAGYSGVPALSSARVGMMDKTEIVPKGEWALVVARPKGDSAGEESAAEVALTVY